jgi:DNA repair exonuclease SbcCD ATPase subunit
MEMAKSTTIDKLAALFSAHRKAANDLRADIDDIEGEIVSLQNELDRVLNAPVDAATIKERVEALIASSIASAEDALSLNALTWREYSDYRLFVRDSPLPRKATLGLIAILGDKDSIRDKLITYVAGGAQNGISDSEREREINRLEAALAERERVMERIHREAEVAGVTIPRRPNADPAALLMPDED